MRDEMVRVSPGTPLIETLLTLYKTRASLRFMLIAFPLMLGSIAICTLYIYLRYL